MSESHDTVLLEREARSLAKLNHQNLLTIHDVGRENGTVYVVTELIQGQSLRALLKKGPLPVTRALGIAAQITDGLAAAHATGVIHRDLKPENVMITTDATAKILDFGIARPTRIGKAESATVTLIDDGHFSGTLQYMAPEQVRGQCDERTDLWALGAVLYEKLSGVCAFQRATPADTISAVLNEEPEPLPPAFPVAITRIVLHCLEKAPTHRFESARDLAFSLRNLEAALGSAAPEAARSILNPTSICRSWIWCSCAAGLIALAAGYIIRAAMEGPRIDYSQLHYRPLASDVGPTQASWSADGKLIAYTGASEDLYIHNLDNPSPTRLSP